MKAARRQTPSDLEAAPVEDPDQLAADIAESVQAAAYRRRRELAVQLDHTVRRAEAHARLDAALRLLTPPR